MDYIRTEADGQLTLAQSTEYLFLPSCLYGFHNTETTVETAKSGSLAGPSTATGARSIFPRMNGTVPADSGCISIRIPTYTSDISA